MKMGKRIRELRKEKDITLEELSQKSGVALATLSRMENNKMPGTVASHIKICKALGVSIAELYKELEERSKTLEISAKSKLPEHFIHARKVKYELLITRPLEKKIMPLLLRLGAGASTQTERNKEGIEKFIYILTGTIEALIGKEKCILKQGDTLYFDASLPHVFSNKGNKEARAVCIISPPEL